MLALLEEVEAAPYFTCAEVPTAAFSLGLQSGSIASLTELVHVTSKSNKHLHTADK